MKHYYGFRFFSGKSTTTGQPHPITGRYNIAGNMAVFKTADELNNWLEKEDLTTPSGLGGGKRIRTTKKGLRKYHLGMSIEDFDMLIEINLEN